MARGVRHDTGPVVAVDVDGLQAAWCGGYFTWTGDPRARQIVREAKLAAEIGQQVRIGHVDVTADASTPLGALAALHAYRPGRTTVIEAPNEVYDAIAGEVEA